MKQHTKTPWKAGGRWGLTSNLGNKLDARQIMSDQQDVIALVADDAGDNGKANAEHIVKCVNSHDKLVEACKEVVKTYKCSPTSMQPLFWLRCLQALAEAGS